MSQHNLPGVTLYDGGAFAPVAGNIIKGVPDEVYHAGPGVSKSVLDRIAENPAKWRLERQHPRPRAEHYEIGKAYHCKVLEPQCFDDRYIRSEHEEFRSKAAKEWRDLQEESGLTVLRTNSKHDVWKPSEWDEVHRMAEAVHTHPIAGPLLDPDDLWVEMSAYWQDDSDVERYAHDATGALCKCRPDAYNTTHELLIDLKTTQHAGLGDFTRSAASYRYHVASAWYTWGWRVKLGLPCRGFVLIVQEKEAPYRVETYTFGRAELDAAMREMFNDLSTYARYLADDVWPNSTGEIRELTFSHWQMARTVR